MRIELTPKYKFVCDRCGKEIDMDAEESFVEPLKRVCFVDCNFLIQNGKSGEVCSECLMDFWELANNFFNDVNREGEIYNV